MSFKGTEDAGLGKHPNNILITSARNIILWSLGLKGSKDVDLGKA